MISSGNFARERRARNHDSFGKSTLHTEVIQYISIYSLCFRGLADMSPYVRPYSQQPMTVLVPNDKAIPTFRDYPQVKWIKLAHFIMLDGIVPVNRIGKIKQGHSIPSQEGCPIYKVSKDGDKTVSISGAKHDSPVARIVKPNLYVSDTLVAHGIDKVMLPCDL